MDTVDKVDSGSQKSVVQESFINNSSLQIYGSDNEVAALLTDRKTGQLVAGSPSPFSSRRKPLLPVIEGVPAGCM